MTGRPPGVKATEPARSHAVVSRRGFASSTAGALGVACSGNITPGESDLHLEPSPRELLVPPAGARVQTTACAYCVVGCGYKAYTWPVEDTGQGASEAVESVNALDVNFPVAPMSGGWVSPQMYNEVAIDGVLHHLVVAPDSDATVVNRGGDYNLGGSLARKLYSPRKPTDRLSQPQLRVGGQLHDISWDDAVTLVAEASRYILEARGPLALGMKTYSYQFYENTYAITKFAFEALGTPCWAPHDKPREASDTPGLSDAGVNAFSASYADWKAADVLFVSGVSLYDAHAVLFNQWVANGPKLVVVNPRRDVTADYAEENGGVFLQLNPGTDTVLQNAIAREILLNEWEDSEFIERACASSAELTATQDDSWRRERFGLSFAEYREFILNAPLHELDNAAAFTGVSSELIGEAARLLGEPVDGVRRKASFMLEKGNYWTHNYTNTASLASLGLLLGAGNRPGQVISRAGGHQRGMVKAAPYPIELSPHQVQGEPAAVNLDSWAMDGNLSLVWVIGCTWAGGGTAAAGSLFKSLQAQVRVGDAEALTVQEAFPNGPGGSLSTEAVLASWRTRVDAGGLLMLQQDFYPQALSALCDLLLPAAGWGEAPFNRMQGERRLRHYPKLADAPGAALPDWQIIAAVAKRMGFAGFDWNDANELFEEAAGATGGANGYIELVEFARETGRSATEVLTDMGTTGIQCPVRRSEVGLEGTVRLHEAGFDTPTGKALFVRGAWEDAAERQSGTMPAADELWVINRRSSGTWSAMIEDARMPFRMALWSENWVDINPEDAARLGISEGDRVSITARDILAQANGETAGIQGVARFALGVRPGVCCLYFNYLADPLLAVNSLVPNTEDPINGLYAFKLARGKVARLV